MVSKTLIPRKKVASEGCVGYSEGFQAWNVIHLKKDIINEFPELKEKRSKFSYKLVYCREIKEALKELKKAEVMPMFLFLYKKN